MSTETATQTQKKVDSVTAKSFAAQEATTPLAPFTIQRRKPLAEDVAIEILF